MTKIANLIKELRLKTKAGFLDCKKALIANNYDLQKSILWLQEKNKVAALNRRQQTKELNQGIVATVVDNNYGLIFKLACETDFVAENQEFINFKDFFQANLKNLKFQADENKQQLTSILNLKIANQKTIQNKIDDLIAQFKEKIVLEKLTLFSKSESQGFGYYTHNNYKNAAFIKFKNKIDFQLGKQLAMHIVAMKPIYLSTKDVEPKEIEIQENLAKKNFENSKKPKFIIEKIVAGKLQKYYQDVCLLEQSYIFNSKQTIKNVLKNINNSIINFKLYQI